MCSAIMLVTDDSRGARFERNGDYGYLDMKAFVQYCRRCYISVSLNYGREGAK